MGGNSNFSSKQKRVKLISNINKKVIINSKKHIIPLLPHFIVYSLIEMIINVHKPLPHAFLLFDIFQRYQAKNRLHLFRLIPHHIPPMMNGQYDNKEQQYEHYRYDFNQLYIVKHDTVNILLIQLIKHLVELLKVSQHLLHVTKL